MDADSLQTRKFDRTFNFFRWMGLGAWLLLVFYVNITIVVMSLTAHQLVHKINATEVNDQAVTTTLIREFVKDINTSEKPRNTAKERLDQHTADVRAKTLEFEARETKLRESFEGDYFLEVERLSITSATDTKEFQTRNAQILARKNKLDKSGLDESKTDLDADLAAYNRKNRRLKSKGEDLKKLENIYKRDELKVPNALQKQIEAHKKDLASLPAIAKELEDRKAKYAEVEKEKRAINEDIKGLSADMTQRKAERDSREVSKLVTRLNALRAEQQRYNEKANCISIKLANIYTKEAQKHIERYNSVVALYGFAAPASMDMEAEPRSSQAEAARSQQSANNAARNTNCTETYQDPGNFENMTMVAPKVQGLVEDFDYFNRIHLDPDSDEVYEGPFKWLQIWKTVEFTKMPTEYLTILLVLSMGMLGGSIRLTRIYLRNEDNENYANYFFFPLMGAVTAFAVYVLAKAGVLIISDTGSGGGALSPYFISFIGLVSGMLADNALDTIQNLGGNWFKEPPAGPDRWAIGLDDRCKNAHEKLTIDEIADLTGYLKETARAWVEEVKPVPYSAQKLISARLNTPIRELFSDIPPRRMAADSMGSMEPDAPTN